MARALLGLSILIWAAPLVAQPTPASLKVKPAAQALFDRDWVLMNWALKHYDANRDILLDPEEARVAADSFRKLADTDHDGRVTPQEYAAARQEILERD